MNLSPINQPTMALSISEEAICLVEVKKSWKRIRLREVNKVSLPSGVIHLSSAKPNIKNMELFIEQLGELAKSVKTPLSIALSLPDLCARTSVFDFSTFPTKKSEQTALLNWRFQQDLKLDTALSRLSYAVYIPTSLATTSKRENPENVRVLGTAIRHEIIEQYEQACLSLNLLPVSVSVAGLDIFDLYQRTIQDILEIEDRRTSSASSGAMFLFISHWGFTFFAFHDGCPSFVRTKAISIRPDSSSVQLDNFDREEPSPSVHSYPSYTVTKVEKEIFATLQYYLETFSQNDTTPTLANLFVVSDLEHGHMLVPASERIQQSVQVSGASISEIQVTQLSYTTHFNAQESPLVPESHIWSALSGYASIRVA